MVYEGDNGKAAANFAKHGIRFADATAVFEDDRALTIAAEHDGESRYAAIGCDFLGRLLVVVFTFRGHKIRLISARKATRRERRMYRE